MNVQFSKGGNALEANVILKAMLCSEPTMA
jgi:hypothetical protein